MDVQLQSTLEQIAGELSFDVSQVAAVVQLLDQENTVPFITRYRKEQTGNLDEVQIREIEQRIHSQRQLADKAETILRLIDGQEKLTPDLRKQIESATTLKRLDDLYRPYRPKRKSRAIAARQQGLEPLARLIRDGIPGALTSAAVEFINPDLGVSDVAAAVAGACDIVAEWIGEDVSVRELARKLAWRTGKITAVADRTKGKVAGECQDYIGFSDQVWRIPPHRILALNRGEKSGVLRVRFEWDRTLVRNSIAEHFAPEDHAHASVMADCIRDSVERLIHPSIEREIRRELTEQSEKHAVSVFSKNLRSLLLQPPLQNERVVAIDPGFRTGCKLAVLDEVGHCLHSDVFYVTGSAGKRAAAVSKLAAILTEYDCTLVAIGNGTACRETEEVISELISSHCPACRYLIVNEAGASIYSASEVARTEFPELDATVRGTISIGRRLQDPLSELVKIDPQHIGVGMYQHDISPRLMKESLDSAVESCVNFVGVNLNTASASLLRYVSGLNQLIARRVVEWRETHGRFSSRRQLLEVSGIGAATYTQAAGFLKITDGDEPLDATWIHPESYEMAERVLQNSSVTVNDLMTSENTEGREQVRKQSTESLAEQLHTGMQTLRDIVDALIRPGRDPRKDLPGPVFRQGVLRLEDLTPGLELQGTVLNVVDFGAFVDVGLKDSGLVHVSQMTDRYISSPHDAVAVGDIITVWVQSVDIERRRVSLTMLDQDRSPTRGRARRAEDPGTASPATPAT